MIQLVCIDVDGTLVGSEGVIPEAVWPAAERVRRRGVHLALCSGRPAFGLTLGLAQRLDPRGWHIFQNGASIVQVASGQSRSHTLPAGSIAQLVAEARGTGRVLELYADDEYVVESTAERARVHAGLLGVPFRARSFESLQKPIVRAQWVVAPEDADEIVGRGYAGLSLARSLSPVMPGTAFVALTAAGVDKASGVEGVARAYGLDMAEVMMVGDAENDLVALRVVGWPVAMGNADAAVRQAARNTVGHVDDGGLVEALRLAERSRA